MRRMIGLLMSLVMLSAAGISKADEEPFTFAGIPWNIRMEEALQLFQEEQGLVFIPYQKYKPYILSAGQYSIWGLEIRKDQDGCLMILGSDSRFNYIDIEFEPEFPFESKPSANSGDVSGTDKYQAAVDQMVSRYGVPTYAFIEIYEDVSSYSGAFMRIAEEELPYIIMDSIIHLTQNGGKRACLNLIFNNVHFYTAIDVESESFLRTEIHYSRGPKKGLLDSRDGLPSIRELQETSPQFPMMAGDAQVKEIIP